MFDRSQLMRGSLEGCILMIIAKQVSYGYEIMMRLKEYGFLDVSEGTIYPILLRLEKQKNIVFTQRPSPMGPKRKYYEITNEGRAYLEDFYQTWREITGRVEVIIQQEYQKEK